MRREHGTQTELLYRKHTLAYFCSGVGYTVVNRVVRVIVWVNGCCQFHIPTYFSSQYATWSKHIMSHTKHHPIHQHANKKSSELKLLRGTKLCNQIRYSSHPCEHLKWSIKILHLAPMSSWHMGFGWKNPLPFDVVTWHTISLDKHGNAWFGRSLQLRISQLPPLQTRADLQFAEVWLSGIFHQLLCNYSINITAVFMRGDHVTNRNKIKS